MVNWLRHQMLEIVAEWAESLNPMKMVLVLHQKRLADPSFHRVVQNHLVVQIHLVGAVQNHLVGAVQNHLVEVVQIRLFEEFQSVVADFEQDLTLPIHHLEVADPILRLNGFLRLWEGRYFPMPLRAPLEASLED